jgi:capsid protein
MRQIKLVSEVDRYPVRDAQGNRQILHILDPKRVSQTRGVSALAGCFDEAGIWQDLSFAKLVQAQATSCFAIIRTQGPKESSPLPSVDGEQFGARQQASRWDGSTQTSEAITPAMQIVADHGEKVEGFSPGVPNAEFFMHAKLILTIIGINLGLPYCVMMMDASETNFSGFRGAVDEARRGFRHIQHVLMNRLHRPVYQWKALQWASDDRVLLAALERLGKKSYLRHSWQPPAWPYIQPKDDAGTDLLRVRNSLTSQRRLNRERSSDWDELSTEIVEDNALAIRKAKREAQQINKEFDDGQPVHWRECLSLPTPDGVSMTLGPEGGAEAADNKPKQLVGSK